MYNYTKLRILYTIQNLTEREEGVTAKAICVELESFNLTISNVKRLLNHYFEYKYITRLPSKKRPHSYAYKLNKLGTITLNKLKKRYEDGKELNLIRRVDLKDVDEYY